jgi:hypothetical protein
MARKAYEPIRVDCLKGQEHSSIRFKDVNAANAWIGIAKACGLIDSAEVILDLEGANK